MVKNGTHLFIDKVILTLDKFALIPEVKTELTINVPPILGLVARKPVSGD